MWKRREACSKAVLIGRGLDQVILVLGRRFHCSILRARGKSTPLRVPAEGWAARTESEEVFVPQAHLLEFQPKAGPRSGTSRGTWGWQAP